MKAFVTIICLAAMVMVKSAPAPTADGPTVDCSTPPRPESEEDWAVLVPNPTDCSSYYVCNGGAPVLMQCPDGLQFNPKLFVCDWPWSANCTIA